MLGVRRGPKPKELIKTKWSANLAYAIGLLATDGCIARYTTLVDLTSKDREQLDNFNHCIGLQLKIGTKSSGYGKDGLRVQIKNRIFYDFLVSIGFTPAKSKTIGEIRIPDKYFYDFLRGCFDGDGCFYSYWDPRWRSSHMFYLEFSSASLNHLLWLQKEIKKKMYYNHKVVCLSRKRIKIQKTLKREKKQQKIYARVEKR